MVISVDIRHIFKYPLEFVVQTHFTKSGAWYHGIGCLYSLCVMFEHGEHPSNMKQYPCKQEKYVERVETVEHQTDVAQGIDYRKRIAVCTNVIPNILRSISVLNEQNMLLKEEAWLDFRKPEFRLRSCNITWSKYAHMWEESTFKPCQDNPKWTLLEQHGVIDVKAFGPFGRVLEMFAERFLHSGVKRGLRIMDQLLEERSGDAPR